MIDDSTVRETVARVAGEDPAAARAAAVARHARDPLRYPAPAAGDDSSTADAPEAGEDTGGREEPQTSAEERSSTGDPEQPRDTTGTSAGAEVAAVVAEAAGLPADMANLLSGSVAQMREQAERLARYRDESAPQPSAPLTRRPSPSLRPGYVKPPAIDAAEIARRAREG